MIAGLAGSFNVIAVNGWMNHPEGFDVVDGKVEDPRPWDALFNAHLPHELAHMYFAGYIVAGFIVAGVYASAWLKREARRLPPHRARGGAQLRRARVVLPGPVGDWAGRTVAENQPVKLAAFEGFRTPRPARPSRSWATTTRTRARSGGGSRSRTCSRCSPATTRTPRSRASTACRRRTGRRST